MLLYGSADDFRKSQIAAALGRAPGSTGLQLLQNLAGDTDQPADVRCAAVHSLARRLGTDASDALRARLGDSDEDVHDQAVIALAAFGNDIAWAEICDDLADGVERYARGQNRDNGGVLSPTREGRSLRPP